MSKEEIRQMKSSRFIKSMCLDDFSTLKSNILEVKGMIHALKSSQVRESIRRRSEVSFPNARLEDSSGNGVLSGETVCPFQLQPSAPPFKLFSQEDNLQNINYLDPTEDECYDRSPLLVAPEKSNYAIEKEVISATEIEDVVEMDDVVVRDDVTKKEVIQTDDVMKKVVKKCDVTAEYGRAGTGPRSWSSVVSTKPSDINKELEKQNSEDETDEANEFQVVNRKKKSSKAYNEVLGLRKNQGPFKSAQRMFDLFVGRCELGVDSSIIKSFLLHEYKINVIECVELDTKYKRAKSFKISLNKNNRDKLLDPEIWPEGVVCKKFYTRR